MRLHTANCHRRRVEARERRWAVQFFQLLHYTHSAMADAAEAMREFEAEIQKMVGIPAHLLSSGPRWPFQGDPTPRRAHYIGVDLSSRPDIHLVVCRGHTADLIVIDDPLAGEPDDPAS